MGMDVKLSIDGVEFSGLTGIIALHILTRLYYTVQKSAEKLDHRSLDPNNPGALVEELTNLVNENFNPDLPAKYVGYMVVDPDDFITKVKTLLTIMENDQL